MRLAKFFYIYFVTGEYVGYIVTVFIATTIGALVLKIVFSPPR